MQLSLPGRPRGRQLTGALALATTAGLAIAPTALAKTEHHTQHAKPAKARPVHTVGRVSQRNLVADTQGAAELRDPDLINAWGLAFTPTSPAWVSDFGSGRATLYQGAVNGSPVTKVPLTVTVPGGMETGQVANVGNGFVVRSGAASGPARFIFATAGGTIVGWNPSVPAANSTDGQVAATVRGASFTGLAIAGNKLFAADFHDGKVITFNSKFQQVKNPNAFRDSRIPRGYAPFGVQTIGNNVVVTYAQQDARRQLDVPGAGHGFVDVFTTNGHLVKRFAQRGTLNSPWGVAIAPKGFGAASGDMLIGNFGNGRVNVFAPRTGRFLGQLGDKNGKPLTIQGLWALKFGNGVIGAPNQLIFTAGPGGGMHGLFGELTAGTTTGTAPTTTGAPATPSAPSTTTSAPAAPSTPANPSMPATPSMPLY